MINQLLNKVHQAFAKMYDDLGKRAREAAEFDAYLENSRHAF